MQAIYEGVTDYTCFLKIFLVWDLSFGICYFSDICLLFFTISQHVLSDVKDISLYDTLCALPFENLPPLHDKYLQTSGDSGQLQETRYFESEP